MRFNRVFLRSDAILHINQFVGALVCVLTLASGATAGDISLSLNLEFNTQGDLNSGGAWTVVAKAEERGIAALVVIFLDSSLNFDPNSGFFLSDVFEIQASKVSGLELEIVQGQDLDPNVTLDVGVIGGTFPSAYVDDPDLAILGANPDLGSFTGGVELVTGSFDPGDLPEWITGALAGNLYVDPGAVVTAADNVFITVRHLVPEPASLALLSLAVVGCVLTARRRS